MRETTIKTESKEFDMPRNRSLTGGISGLEFKIKSNCMIFVPCIVIQLWSVNQQ